MTKRQLWSLLRSLIGILGLLTKLHHHTGCFRESEVHRLSVKADGVVVCPSYLTRIIHDHMASPQDHWRYSVSKCRTWSTEG